jgi:hypothetical protein
VYHVSILKFVPRIGIYRSACSFSLEGEGWDEGVEADDFILLSPTLSSRRGSKVVLQLIVFSSASQSKIFKTIASTFL